MGTFVTTSTYGFGIGAGFVRDGGKTSTVELPVISSGTFVTISSSGPGIGARQRALLGQSMLTRQVIIGGIFNVRSKFGSRIGI
jgi:hypothetical protein